MLAAACAATGLDHFGEPDPRVSLQELVRSLNDEAQLTAAGAAGKRASLIRVLANRLLLQHAFDSNAALARETIRAPIVILGLPRSGTTKLHRMIAADPIMQKLPLWRLLYPVRALAPAATAEDPRIAAARQFVDVLRQRSPDTYAAHPMDALEPDEEYFGMELSFLSNLNTSSFHTPAYERWLDAQAFDSWYAWLEKLLQYTQHSERASGRPWVLKAPHHLGYLPLLFERFPGTTIVHCHRDPVTAVASFCALLQASRRSTSSLDDPQEIGRYVMRIYGTRMQRYLRDRAALESHARFIDVAYAGDRERGARRHRALLCSRRARPASVVAAGDAALGSREPASTRTAATSTSSPISVCRPRPCRRRSAPITSASSAFSDRRSRHMNSPDRDIPGLAASLPQWERMLASLQATGQHIARGSRVQTPLAQAQLCRYLQRVLRGMLLTAIEVDDADYPQLVQALRHLPAVWQLESGLHVLPRHRRAAARLPDPWPARDRTHRRDPAHGRAFRRGARLTRACGR